MSDAAGDDGREERRPRWGAMLGWSALMLAVSLLVAAIAVPVLRWLGFDAG